MAHQLYGPDYPGAYDDAPEEDEQIRLDYQCPDPVQGDAS